MPLDISCRLIFLASPGGLDHERVACRQEVQLRNEQDMLRTQSVFYLQAWEDVPGGVGRPQDRINPRLDECDYAVFMFNDWWGTPPARSDKTYTSGTEEEFFRATELLADPDAPMRDILVLFKSLDPAKIRDPGDSLQQVLRFRNRLEASKDILYEVFDSTENLTMRLARKLRDWEGNLEEKVPRVVSLSEVEVQAAPSASEGSENILAAAKSYADAGRLLQAEAAFSVAVQDEDPTALLAFAKFMRRTGRMEQASQLNFQVVNQPELLNDHAGTSVAHRVEALANIGILQRKAGHHADSVRTLAEAVQTAETSLDPIPSIQCYALDNFGHSLLAVDMRDQALEQFKASSSLREQYGTPDERAQSAINIGRIHLKFAQFEAALNEFNRALRVLGDGADDHLVANALAGAAEARINLEQFEEVPKALQKAIEANERLHNRDGQSIIHGLWIRYYMATGQPEKAQSHLVAAEELVDITGNVHGRRVLQQLRGDLLAKQNAL